LSSTSYQTSFGIITTSKFNLNLITIFTIIITYIYELVVKNLSYKIKTNNYIFSIKLFQGKNSISINAFLDTGNLLTYSNKPVVILDLKTYLKLTKTNLIEFFLNSKESTNLKTVSGENNLKIFKIDKMEIKEKRKQIIHENLFVAVNTTSAFKETNYKALLSPLFM